MAEKVRLGFVSCGGIAEAHMKALVKTIEVTLAANKSMDIGRPVEIRESS